jgi:hypothetical protein
MFVEESGETSDVVAEKSVAVEFCSMSVYQRTGCEVAGGRGRKILERWSPCGYEEISSAHNLCKLQATPGMIASIIWKI